MDAEEFGTRLVAMARKSLNVRETGPNTDRGGFIDRSLAACGLPPGKSWCAAAICEWVRRTADESQVRVAFRRSARALGLLELNPGLRVTDPRPGDVIVWDHGGGLGHVAILTDVVEMSEADGKRTVIGLAAIAGNTSADGHSRNGDRVAEHPVTYPDPKITGYLRIVPVLP